MSSGPQPPPRRQLPWLLAGILTVVLAACGGGGGSSGPPPNEPPTASFDATPVNGEAPLTVNFDAGDSTDSDGDITSYEWDFGNGETATGATARTTYEVAGDFDATLDVTDDDGASDSTTNTITITEPTTFSVSGSIRIFSGSEVDVDTNDINTEDGDNDNFDTAQPIGNPANIGGYVTEAGEGESGLVSSEGDVSDFYQFTSVGNETLVLTIGDASPNNDLDLRLYNEERQLVDESSGLEQTESFDVPASGNYFIEVTAISGASTYVLALGQNQIASHKSLRLSSSFVPGEIVLGPPRKNQNATGELKGRASGLKTLSPASRGQGHRLVRLPATSHRVDRLGALGAQPRRFPGTPLSADTLERLDTIHAIKLLRREGRYTYVEPNYIRRPGRVPNDQFLDRQWHYRNIKLEQAWELTTGSSDVIVGVIDTGVLLGHPDLSPRLTNDGYDFISDPERALDGDGIDPDPNDPGDLELGDRSTFHGTHVAGTVAAQTDNETGVAGAGWNTRIMPLRVLGNGGGTSADVIQAIRYAAGLANDSNTLPDTAVDIINLSLGGNAFSQAEQDAIDAARAGGIIVVAAAGNQSRDSVTFPAGYDGVVGVSATTITNGLAFYSNTGAGVDVAAPGGDTSTDVNGDGVADGVMSTLGDDSGGASDPKFIYSLLAGTSMATPHVSGVAALMRAEAPEITPDQFDALLATGDITDDLGAPGRDDQFGHGLINAQKAVVAAGDGTLKAFIVASPSTLNFGAVGERLELDVDNAGTENATVNDVRSDESWLTVTPVDLDATGAGIYQVNVDRTGLNDDIFRGNIDIETSANNISVPVVMRVSSLDVDADAGFHYIVLLDESDENVNQDTAVAVDGRYTFQFERVEPGRYRVAAGSDADNDRFICDAGEACGFYRTLDSPTTIEVEEDLSGLEFVTGFRASLSSSGAQAEGEPGNPVIEPVRIGPPRPKEVEQ